MTVADDPRFVPPEQHPVAGPPASAPLPPPVPPAAYAAPSGYTPPAGLYAPPPVYPGPPKKRGMPTGGIVAIIVGALALFILAIAFLVWFVSTQIDDVIGDGGSFGGDDYYPDTSQTPLVQGERSTPVAEEPLECAEPCFDGDPSGAVSLSDEELDRVGLTVDETYIPSSTPRIDSIVAERAWIVSDATPHFCVFTLPAAPLTSVTDIEDPLIDTESIFYSWTAIDESYSTTLEQSTRYFATSDDATAYLATMDKEIDGCTGFSMTHNDPFAPADQGYTTEEWDVTRAPALALPASVAAVGWVESDGYSRNYTFDMQRGNVVIRTILTSWDGPSEAQFRTLTEAMAERLAEVPLAK